MVKYKDVFKKKEKYIRPILHPKKKHMLICLPIGIQKLSESLQSLFYIVIIGIKVRSFFYLTTKPLNKFYVAYDPKNFTII